MSTAVAEPVVVQARKPRRPQRHSNPIRVKDLARFFGVHPKVIEKDIKHGDLDVYDIDSVLTYVAKRVIQPYLGIL